MKYIFKYISNKYIYIKNSEIINNQIIAMSDKKLDKP